MVVQSKSDYLDNDHFRHSFSDVAHSNCILAFLLLGCQITQSASLPCVTRKAFCSVLWLFSSFWILYSLDYTLSLQNLLVATSTPVFLCKNAWHQAAITITNSAALSSACFSPWFINIQLCCEEADVKFLDY